MASEAVVERLQPASELLCHVGGHVAGDGELDQTPNLIGQKPHLLFPARQRGVSVGARGRVMIEGHAGHRMVRVRSGCSRGSAHSRSSTVVRTRSLEESRGRLIVRKTSVDGNTADGPAGHAEGGGIYVDEGSTKTALVSAAIAGNEATGARPRGGGMFFRGGAKITLTRTAVSGNLPENCSPPKSVTGCHG